MREILWLRLRKSKLLRKLYSVPFAAQPMKVLSYWLLPSNKKRKLKVRSGPGEGLVFNLNPRWEMPLWEGRYEVAIEKVILENLRPNDVFYDVGAAFGFYSLLAARAGARVFAFEPDLQNVESFEHHVKLNSLQSKIELIQFAVTSWDGTGQLEPAGQERGHGNAHVLKSEDVIQGALKISCTTLDHFAAAMPSPQLIKIDVEGSESDVFSGAKELFDRCRPVVICEIHDSLNEAFVINWFGGRNYLFRWIRSENDYPKHLVAIPE